MASNDAVCAATENTLQHAGVLHRKEALRHDDVEQYGHHQGDDGD